MASNQMLTPPRSPWVLAFVLMSAVFVFGGIVGASGALAFMWHRDPRALGPQDFPVGRMVQDMQRGLNLSADQTAAIERILEEHRQRMRVIHEELRPRVEAEMETMRAQVAAALTPDQAQQWNSRFDNAWKHWMPPGPGEGMGRHRGGPPPDGMGRGPGAGRGRFGGRGPRGPGAGLERPDAPPAGPDGRPGPLPPNGGMERFGPPPPPATGN